MNKDNTTIISQRRETIGRVKHLLINALQLDLDPDEIADDSPLFGFGLGLDSIDALTLIVAVEHEFGIKVSSNEDMNMIRSVNTIADSVIRESRDSVIV